jgi:DNA repair protein RadC
MLFSGGQFAPAKGGQFGPARGGLFPPAKGGQYVRLFQSTSRAKISASKDAFNLFWAHWDLEQIEHSEEFKILLLNRSNKVLGIADISKGGIAGTVTDIRIIFQYALKAHATSVILAHNHPSGNSLPSEADIQITKKLIEAGKILDIQVLDHIILCGDETYISLADEGRM